MIEIKDGFTNISAGSSHASPLAQSRYRPSGARVTVEFCREAALSPGQVVCAKYDFAGNGQLRKVEGVASPTHAVARAGQATLFHYRISQWIEPAALMRPTADEPAT